MFWWNLTKIGQIYVSNKFPQICHIPPKIKFEILAHRGSQTTSPHARRLLVSSNRKQWNNCTSWRQWRWIKILDRSVERWGGRHNNEQSCQRQRKPAVKMEKPENVLRSKTTNRQTTFKITIWGDCWCLCIQGSIKKRKPRFQHCVWQSLVGRRLLCSKYGRQRGAPTLQVSFTKEIFFFSLQNGTLSFFFGPFISFFFFFLPRSFFRSWFFRQQRFFHKQRASTSGFFKVRDVNKIWNYI